MAGGARFGKRARRLQGGSRGSAAMGGRMVVASSGSGGVGWWRSGLINTRGLVVVSCIIQYFYNTLYNTRCIFCSEATLSQ